MYLKNNNKIYKKNNHIVYSCQYHIIWTTKYRRKVIVWEIEDRIKELILEKQNEYWYEILEMEVMPDHIHLLIDINPKIWIFTITNKIKWYTSNILRKEFKILRSKLPTLWTHSKFISTVWSVSLEVVKKYIENQKNV